jgi:hypothetical protein
MTSLIRIAAAILPVIWIGVTRAQPAPADPPAPDKTGFTVFDPTPDDDLRGFETDRPGRSNTPYTVDAGHVQYETDLFNAAFSHSGSVTSRIFITADPVLKLGLTNDSDLELAIGGFQSLRTVDRSSGTVVTASGFGDLDLRLKVNLLGNDDGFAALAVIPYVKLPTAHQYLGNGQFEGGVIAPLQLNLPYKLALILMPELDVLKNADNGGNHLNLANLISLARPIYGDLSGSVEFAASNGTDRHTLPVQTLDFTLSYLLTPNLQVDVAFYAGLDRGAPAQTLYTGLSQRF